MIELINISKKYGNKQVLDKVDMQICTGTIVGLYGESGEGKSTLAKILCGVVVPDGGRVELDGKPLLSDKQKYDRKLGLGVQMVYQQPYSVLDPSQKIINGLKELIRYHSIVKADETDSFIDRIAEEMDLDKDIFYHLPHQISGGEAQRIAIAKSLMLEPRLLILDEATSMLDISTQANVLGIIKKQTKKYDGSILIISHDKQLLDCICNSVFELHNSKITQRK